MKRELTPDELEDARRHLEKLVRTHEEMQYAGSRPLAKLVEMQIEREFGFVLTEHGTFDHKSRVNKL